MDLKKEIILNREKNMDNISNAVAYACGIPKKELLSRQRFRHLVDARKMMYKLIKEIYDYPLMVMGRFFGKNHATILHQISEHDKLIRYDKLYESRYIQILDLITSDPEKFTTQKLLLKEKEYYEERLKSINIKLMRDE